MPNVNQTCTNFVGGELSPSLNARSDIKVYPNSCSRLENFILETVGPAKYRTGTKFVNHTRRNALARLIPFQFSDEQSYLIECTPGYFRFYKDGGIIVGEGNSIICVGAVDPGTIWVQNHGLSNGDEIFISEAIGSLKVLNNNSYIVSNVTEDTFTIKDSVTNADIDLSEYSIIDGNDIDLSVYDGGIASMSSVSTESKDGGNAASRYNSKDVINGGNSKSKYSSTDVLDGNPSDLTSLSNILDANNSYIPCKGIIECIVEVKTPYANTGSLTDEEIMDYLNKIQYAQNADTMYLVHPQYPPYKLTRSSHTQWSLATYSRTSDPFTKTGDYPHAVCFDGAGRLIFGGTDNDPEMLIMSRGPDSKTGEQRYDDFTTGNLANDAIKIYLSPSQGKVEAVQWLIANDRYFLVGTFSGVRRVVSADGYDSAFSATSGVLIKPIDSSGCEKIRPIPKGNSLFYMQRGGLILRCLKYDIYYDSYKAEDKNLVSDLILDGGTREVVFQQGRPDILWHIRKDGKLIGLTYHETEDIAGWHRQNIGGTDSKVISAGIMPRSNNYEQLWVVVERNINGIVQRYVEYFTDFEHFKVIEDFYTDEEHSKADQNKYENDLYQRQKLEIHLDSSLTYDGSAIGVSEKITLTIGNANDSGVATVSTNVAIFKPTDVSREIWRIYDENGVGTGKMTIVEWINGNTVKCRILSNFDKKILSPGEWTLTTSSLSGLYHLEGETVNIVTDGALHTEKVVENGKIALDKQADVVHVGYGYRGLLKTMNIQAGGTTGSAQNKLRHIQNISFEFLNTLGVKYGTSLYDLSKVLFRKPEHKTGRPSPLFSGSKKVDVRDNTEDKKFCYVVQDTPLPCTIQAIDIFMETIDE